MGEKDLVWILGGLLLRGEMGMDVGDFILGTGFGA